MPTLTELHTQMKKCERCGLRNGCTQVVPGEGCETAKIMFLAEAPGISEDEIGRPLVGRAGQMFQNQLEQIGLTRSTVYVSNIARCRPPDNRVPTNEESDACWFWTGQTLDIVQPKIIVTMGATALSVLGQHLGFSRKLGQLGIMKLAGKAIYIPDKNQYVFPMTHPSHALRGHKNREIFESYFNYLHRAIPGWLERPAEEVEPAKVK